MVDEVDDGALALTWATTLIDGLVEAGLEQAVIAPGSRSTPLVLAAADHADLEVRSHLDERSAGFFALGRGKVSDPPTAVITTSGTATANLLPAMVEAHEARTPVLAITASRPPELIDSGANQTIRQDRLYGDFTRWERTLGEPSLDDHRLRSLRSIAARAIAEANGPPAGGVHLNVPLRKPLEPDSVEDRHEAKRLAGGSTPRIFGQSSRPKQSAVHEVAARIDARDDRLLVVGPAELDEAEADAVFDLARATGAPVLANPASGVRNRHPHQTTVCGGYDGYIEAITSDIGRPDLIIRIGPEPTSSSLQRFLDTPSATQVLIDPVPAWRDSTHNLDAILRGDIGPTARTLAETITRPRQTGYSDRFERAEATYWNELEEPLSTHYFEGAIAAHVVETLSEETLLFVGNSMPIRDVDRFAKPRRDGPTIIANRGVSGIDGNISTALGAAEAAGRPVVTLLGDLATYHDMNGLLAIERFDLDGSLVVVNNDGGGIFHMLPIEDHDPPFEQLFKTPHGLDFEATADQYGLTYRHVSNLQGLTSAISSDLEEGGHLVECEIDAQRSHRTRERISNEVSQAVADAVR